MSFLIIGYCLQYLFKFRRDRGYSNTEFTFDIHSLFKEGGWFVYIIPNVLHLFGYLSSITVFKLRDSEQFPGIIEKVFILSNGSKVLMLDLWSYFVIGFLWLICSTTFTFTMSEGPVIFDTLHYEVFGLSTEETCRFLKILLIISTCCIDVVQIIVLISYCVNCYLLRFYLYSIKEKLLHHNIEGLDWMRELNQFKQFVKFLNSYVSFPISVYLILNLMYALSGTIYLIYNMSVYDGCCEAKIKTCIGNTISWFMVVLMPLYQAAKLNGACRAINSCGHSIRVRPFAYQNTKNEDLDSVLLFTSSLKVSAKICCIPIYSNYLCSVIVGLIVTLLTIGLYMNRD